MLAHLLESNAQRNRSVWGALASTAGHTVVIAVAVFATAQARVDEPGKVEVVRWVSPPAPRPPTEAVARPVERPALPAPPDLRLLDRISVATPSIDLLSGLPASNAVDITGGTAVPEPTSDHRTGVPTTEPLTADQVDRQVYLRPGSRSPRYPDALRARGVEGQVVALFVVNERGRAELGSVRFTRSDNALFEAAVRDVLATLQFSPAEVGGRKVAQLVQMPFVFTLSRQFGRRHEFIDS